VSTGTGSTGAASTGAGATSKATPSPPAAYRLIDRTGVVFRTVSRPPSGLPIIEVTSPGPQDGSTLGALSVLASLPASLRDELDHITAPAPAEIALMLKDGREVVWGDATDNATKASVAVSLLHHSGQVIDVSAPNLVTVR
jgi:cell division protein FtsQ